MHVAVSVASSGELVSKESLRELKGVSMQQIKTGLFHFKLSIMVGRLKKNFSHLKGQEEIGQMHTFITMSCT